MATGFGIPIEKETICGVHATRVPAHREKEKSEAA